MPAGQAEVLADEQISLLNSNLATKQDLANVATRDDLSNFATKDDLSNFATKQDVAILKSEVSTLKWIVASVGFGMLTVMLGVSSLVINLFWTV